MKNKYFGTDGIRGTVNEGNITGEKFIKADNTHIKDRINTNINNYLEKIRNTNKYVTYYEICTNMQQQTK